MSISADAWIGLITGMVGAAVSYLTLKREATNAALEQARIVERRFTILESELNNTKNELEEMRELITETQQTTNEIFALLMIPDSK